MEQRIHTSDGYELNEIENVNLQADTEEVDFKMIQTPDLVLLASTFPTSPSTTSLTSLPLPEYMLPAYNPSQLDISNPFQSPPNNYSSLLLSDPPTINSSHSTSLCSPFLSHSHLQNSNYLPTPVDLVRRRPPPLSATSPMPICILSL